MPALLLAGCAQDEPLSPTAGDDLPPETYPLQISSLTISGGEEPWTRVAENEDGSGSVWQPDDAITVSLDGETATYTYDGSAWTSEAPLYWKNTLPAEVTAWYPATDGALDFSDQKNGLAYLLRAEQTAAYGDAPVSLQFTHQLAKVRVVTKGTADVTDIKLVNVPTYCHIEEGKITKQEGSTSARIDMLQVEREGIDTYWEATVGPGVEIQRFNIDAMNCDLDSPVTTQAGALHTITWTVNSAGTQSIRLSTDSIGSNGTEQSQ